MTKVRKFCIGDYVTFGSYEWIVVAKTKSHCKLVRREVSTTTSVRVNKFALKHADQTWRDNLRPNDPLKLFISGVWAPSRVCRRSGDYVYVQPSFTNYAKKVHIHSSRIVYFSHNFPLWAEDEMKEVMFEGQVRTQRGTGLLYPWQYGETLLIPQIKPKHIKDLKFKLSEINPGLFPFFLYNRLSSEEIIYDLRENSSSVRQLPMLFDLVFQYINSTEAKYPIFKENTLQVFIEVALANDDNRRVNELLSAVGHEQLFVTHEWVVQDDLSNPYFDLKFAVEGDYLIVSLFWWQRRRKGRLGDSLRRIFDVISEPQTYDPLIIEVEGSPEQGYILSRMLGMELEPLETLHLRRIASRRSGTHWLTMNRGIVKPSFNHFGGVLSTCPMNYKSVIKNLVKRSPYKTLVIVHADVINNWTDANFSIWHGQNRQQNKNIVVTTRNTFIKTWTELVGFQRLMCLAIPQKHSVYHRVLQSFSCKTRWALVDNGDCSGAFLVLGQPMHKQACILLNKTLMENMGVEFPEITQRRIYCKAYSYENVLKNLHGQSEDRKADIISRYLTHTGLIPKYLTGEKQETVEATVDKICRQFKLKKERLEGQLKDRCCVCLEPLSEAMVTKCGHAFCPDCTKELKERNSTCPMCRERIDGYVKVSKTNTKGKFVMHRGTCYKITGEERWGEKFNYVKKNHRNATIITKHGCVKNKLRKAFPKTEIITTSAIEHGAKVSFGKIISMEPLPLSATKALSRAWGKDLDITCLSYRINL